MSVVEFPAPRQQQLKAKFICSACGADRGCNCNAPAVEKLAQKQEQDRQRAREYRARKAEENQQPRHVTEATVEKPIEADDAETTAEAMKIAHAAAEAKAEPQAEPVDASDDGDKRTDVDTFAVSIWIENLHEIIEPHIAKTTVEAVVKEIRGYESVDVNTVRRVADFLQDVVDELEEPRDPDDDGEPEEPGEHDGEPTPVGTISAAEEWPTVTLHTPLYDVRDDAYCGPTAASAITGLPISEIEDAIRVASGKVSRADGSKWPVRGIHNKDLLAAMQSLGWSAVEQTPPDERYRLHDFARDHGHDGPFIVEVSGHYVAIAGGEFCDTTTCLPKDLGNGVLDRPGFGVKSKGRARVRRWWRFAPTASKAEAADTVPSYRADRAAARASQSAAPAESP